MRTPYRPARYYELMTIFTPDVPEEELPGLLDQVVGYVNAAGGRLIDMSRESPWGRRRLAYPIRHGGRDLRDGFYTLYHFQCHPSRINEVERELKLNERVIRYLLVTYTPKDEPAEAATDAAEEAPAETTATAEAAPAEASAVEAAPAEAGEGASSEPATAEAAAEATPAEAGEEEPSEPDRQTEEG